MLHTQAMTGVRTVASLCAERWAVGRYSKQLILAVKVGIASSIQHGLGNGLCFACLYCFYALAFWCVLGQSLRSLVLLRLLAAPLVHSIASYS
jgi:hypothetical protein